MTSETKTPSPPPSPKPADKPILLFSNPNLEIGKVANTFRVGLKWSTRVKDGDVVTLAQTEGEKPFGEAIVLQVLTGTWEELKGFASDNHEYRGWSPTEAQGSLLPNIQSHYPDYKADSDKLTVLYLNRTK